jgi:methylmalonyl-CoA mutase, N-terminal domain
LGGSYFVESLTKTIADQIWDNLHEVLERGGAIATMANGFSREIMNRGAMNRQRRIDSGERPWVTVNKWPSVPQVPNTAFRMDKSTVSRQHQRTQALRQSRDNAAVRQVLAHVQEACASGGNLVPSTLAAIKAYATVGEIAQIWRQHFGEFHPSASF